MFTGILIGLGIGALLVLVIFIWCALHWGGIQ